MEIPTQQIIFSGIQPSGTLHIGNYLGAIKQWLRLAESNQSFFCIVDEHAITVPYEAKELPERVLATAAFYVACGLKPNQSTIFIQSHVHEHTELAWLLSSLTPYGELTRMTQFKDKAKKQAQATSVGLFTYPLLMAADILLYRTTVVPVGDDQIQHIELTRDIAKRFNSRFGECLTVPNPLVNPQSARIMSLTDPKKKMSKSDEPKSYIALTDDAQTIRQKIASATTDSKAIFSFAKSGLAVKNLLNIYLSFSGQEPKTIEDKFSGQGYKEFKDALADTIISALEPIQTNYKLLRENDDELRIMLGRGKHQAQQVAASTLRDVKEKMGLI